MQMNRTRYLFVKVLQCRACTKSHSYIHGMKNYIYFSVWTTGSANRRASNNADHAANELHKVVVTHFHTEHLNESRQVVIEQSPIIKAC